MPERLLASIGIYTFTVSILKLFRFFLGSGLLSLSVNVFDEGDGWDIYYQNTRKAQK